MTPLLAVAKLSTDRVLPWPGSRPYVATGDADDDGGITPVDITYDDRPSRADLTANAGDVVLARMAQTSKVFEVDARLATYVYSTGFAILRIDPAVTDPRFVAHWLRSDALQRAKDRYSTGATQRAITNAGLAQLQIPDLALGEQRRIADILDGASALRANARRTRAAFDDLPRALFLEGFGGAPATAAIESLALATRTGPFGSQLLHSEFVDDGVAVLGLDNVVENTFQWKQRRYISPAKYEQLKKYTVRPGDVLVSIMGTTGRCVVVPDDIPTAINTKHLCAITVDQSQVEPEFLRASLLWHPETRAFLRRQTKGSIMDGLNMGIVKAAPIPLPEVELQREYARRCRGIAAGRADAERAATRVDELFTALEQRAFTTAA